MGRFNSPWLVYCGSLAGVRFGSVPVLGSSDRTDVVCHARADRQRPRTERQKNFGVTRFEFVMVNFPDGERPLERNLKVVASKIAGRDADRKAEWANLAGGTLRNFPHASSERHPSVV